MKSFTSPMGAAAATVSPSSVTTAPAATAATSNCNPLEALREKWWVPIALDTLMVIVIFFQGCYIGNRLLGVNVMSYWWTWAVVSGATIIILRDWIAKRQTPDFIHKSGKAMVIIGFVICLISSFNGGYEGKKDGAMGAAQDYSIHQAGQDFRRWNDKLSNSGNTAPSSNASSYMTIYPGQKKTIILKAGQRTPYMINFSVGQLSCDISSHNDHFIMHFSDGTSYEAWNMKTWPQKTNPEITLEAVDEDQEITVYRKA